MGVQNVSWGGCGGLRFILEPQGSVLDRFLYFSRASLLALLISSVSLLSSISLLIPLFSLLSSLFKMLSSLFSLRVSLRSLQRRGGFREATGIRRAAPRCQRRSKAAPPKPEAYNPSAHSTDPPKCCKVRHFREVPPRATHISRDSLVLRDWFSFFRARGAPETPPRALPRHS